MKKLSIYFVSLFFLVACESKDKLIEAIQNPEIEMVKGAVLEFNKTLTVGEALDNWKSCKGSEWQFYTSDNGVKVVEFICIHNTDAMFEGAQKIYAEHMQRGELDVKPLLEIETFQFTINKDDTFQLAHNKYETRNIEGELLQEKNSLGFSGEYSLMQAYSNIMRYVDPEDYNINLYILDDFMEYSWKETPKTLFKPGVMIVKLKTLQEHAKKDAEMERLGNLPAEAAPSEAEDSQINNDAPPAEEAPAEAI